MQKDELHAGPEIAGQVKGVRANSGSERLGDEG